MKQKKTNSNPLVKILRKEQGDNPLIDLMEMVLNVHYKIAADQLAEDCIKIAPDADEDVLHRLADVWVETVVTTLLIVDSTELVAVLEEQLAVITAIIDGEFDDEFDDEFE